MKTRNNNTRVYRRRRHVYLLIFFFKFLFLKNLRTFYQVWSRKKSSIEPRVNSFWGGLVADLISSIDFLVGGTRSYQITMKQFLRLDHELSVAGVGVSVESGKPSFSFQ